MLLLIGNQPLDYSAENDSGNDWKPKSEGSGAAKGRCFRGKWFWEEQGVIWARGLNDLSFFFSKSRLIP